MSMDSERWKRIQDIFHQALELPAAAQAEFVRDTCSGDGELEADVNAMLHEDARGSHLLDSTLADVASAAFDSPESTMQTFREFGPYRATRVLGEGGMGIVYLAERPDLKSQVAIKVLRDAWLSPSRRE